MSIFHRAAIVLLSCVCSVSLLAQVKVTGKVTDNAGEPLSGASVIVKGTNVGAATDADGMYSINVPNENATLVISFMSFVTVEKTVGNRTMINVTMEEDMAKLEEVVVTALGMKRETRALGYAISSIKGSDMVVAGNTVNPLTTLYGKAAGVGVQAGIAGPTGGVNIKIRGAASLETTSKTRPLFVVDGVPIYDKESNMSTRGYDPLNSFDYGSGINDVNPEDIESMEILKGAKASVLYGSEGANGVILITSKKGARTKGLGIQFSYQHTFEQPYSYIDWQNEYGSGGSVNDINQPDGEPRKIISNRQSFGPKFDGSPIKFFDGSISPYKAYPNNFIDLFRNGSSDNVSVAISGGNEKSNMRLSYSNYKYNGIMDNFNQMKNTLSFSGQMHVSDFASFEVTNNLYYVSTHNRLPNISNIVAYGIHRDYDYNKLKAIYLTNDGYINKELINEAGLPNSSLSLIDVWWHQNRNSNTDTKMHNITSARATLKFLPFLYFVGQGGIDYSNIDYVTENPIREKDPLRGGKYSFRRENYFIQNYDGFLNFEKAFMDDRLNVHVFAGPSLRSVSDNNIAVSTYGGLKYPDWYSLTNGKEWPGQSNADNVRGHSRASEVTYSLSGAATVSWKNIYYVELSARNDWSSTLPPENNSYFYPGISFTWNFSEVFNIPYVNYAKLFASFADVGRPAPRYFALKSYDIGFIPSSPDQITVNGPGDLFAGNLKPERKREFEIGLNTRMFKMNRLEFNFSFYTNNIYDQIMSVPLSNPTGAANIRINAGNVRNWGYELFVKFAPIAHNDYRWDITLTSANQYSKVKKLYPGITRKPLGGGGYSVVADEGKRLGEILMYDYVRDPKGNRVVDEYGQYKLDKSEMKPIGKNINPDLFGGVMSDFFWKGFFVHLGLDYKFGGSIFSYSNYYLTGLGSTKNTLPYRDEEHGGKAYYIKTVDKKDQIVPWEHDKPAPQDAKNGRVYHNGIILKGVQQNADGTYSPNERIGSSTSYYTSFMSDMSDAFQPDALFKNDYIKVREISLGYTLPKKWSEKVLLQKVTVSLVARNLFYLYKTLPNVDAESVLGTNGSNSYSESSFYPTTRTYGFGLNISF